EERSHAAPDRLVAVEAEARALADGGAPEEKVLERDCHLLADGKVKLGHDLRIAGTDPRRAVGQLLREIEAARVTPPVSPHKNFERLAGKPGRRDLVGDVHPRPRLELARLLLQPL